MTTEKGKEGLQAQEFRIMGWLQPNPPANIITPGRYTRDFCFDHGGGFLPGFGRIRSGMEGSHYTTLRQRENLE